MRRAERNRDQADVQTLRQLGDECGEQSWERPGAEESREEFDLTKIISAEEIAAIDPFDRAQLVYVLGVCCESVSLSDAGRKLFAVSREKRAVANDADRLKKYLKKFGVTFDQIKR